MNIVSFAIGLNNSSQGEKKPTTEELTFTGNLSRYFYQDKFYWVIDIYGNQITTKDITVLDECFCDAPSISKIPFEINCKNGINVSTYRLFSNAHGLVQAPKVNNAKIINIDELFMGCYLIASIPENYTENWDWSNCSDNTQNVRMRSPYTRMSNLRSYCYDLIAHEPLGQNSTYYLIYSSLFLQCYILDAIKVPVFTNIEIKTNSFDGAFGETTRLKQLVFAVQDNGQPYTAKWTQQKINLNYYNGYDMWKRIFNIPNKPIPSNKEVKDDATYQALKNDPDWYTTKKEYSRYNHDSAVETINSLPDTSAYLAENGGTNTIVFLGSSGSATDGGAINTLTEEEIAVATAKGWAVSFT